MVITKILFSNYYTLIKTIKLIKEILEKSSDEEEKTQAEKEIKNAEKSLKKREWEAAFNNIAYAKFHLFGTEYYREPLVEAIEDALDELWKLIRGRGGKVSQVKEKLSKIKKLLKEPKGELSNRPVRVKNLRDIRLWEAAKRIAREQYDFDEEDERYWKVTSRIFTRMKYRLGGSPEKKVEEFLRELERKKEKKEGGD